MLTSDDKNGTIELEQMFFKGVNGLAGAFQTSREVFSNSIWRNIAEFRLFFLIYGHACFKDNVKIHGVTLRRGQWIRSYRNLQEDLEYIENRSVKQYSLSVIKRAIDSLVKNERLKIKECELGTLFEVVNYAKYQGLDNYKTDNENGVGTGLEQGWNGDGTELEQQQNKKKNAKNAKHIYDDFFESMWLLYPRKEGKAQVSGKQKMELYNIGIDEITRAVNRYTKVKQGVDKQYLQHGSTFFNSGYVDYLDKNYTEDKPQSQYRRSE